MKYKFFSNLILILLLNVVIKPLYILGIDAEILKITEYNNPGAYGTYFSLLNLNFYRIKFIESYADISSSIHTKQNTSERLKNIELKKTRFTDIEKKKKFQEDVKNKLYILNKNQLLEANYKKLINIKI